MENTILETMQESLPQIPFYDNDVFDDGEGMPTQEHLDLKSRIKRGYLYIDLEVDHSTVYADYHGEMEEPLFIHKKLQDWATEYGAYWDWSSSAELILIED